MTDMWRINAIRYMSEKGLVNSPSGCELVLRTVSEIMWKNLENKSKIGSFRKHTLVLGYDEAGRT